MMRAVPSHPNRGRAPTVGRNPKPADVRAAREAAGLTQTAAAEVIHTQVRVWQQWESGERRMHPAFFELFQLKTATK